MDLIWGFVFELFCFVILSILSLCWFLFQFYRFRETIFKYPSSVCCLSQFYFIFLSKWLFSVSLNLHFFATFFCLNKKECQWVPRYLVLTPETCTCVFCGLNLAYRIYTTVAERTSYFCLARKLIWPLWSSHVFIQWVWLILFSPDHFPGQHKNGVSPSNYFFLKTFRAGRAYFPTAPSITTECVGEWSFQIIEQSIFSYQVDQPTFTSRRPHNRDEKPNSRRDLLSTAMRPTPTKAYATSSVSPHRVFLTRRSFQARSLGCDFVR